MSFAESYDSRPPLGYVAGPYSHDDPVENTHHAWRKGCEIYEQFGVPMIVPHLTLLAHLITPRPESFWYEYDYHLLDRCNFIYRLPGASKGADREVARHLEQNGEVVHSEAELRYLLRNWGWNWNERKWAR